MLDCGTCREWHVQCTALAGDLENAMEEDIARGDLEFEIGFAFMNVSKLLRHSIKLLHIPSAYLEGTVLCFMLHASWVSHGRTSS